MSVTKEFQFFHKRKNLPADLEQDGGMESDPSPLPIFPLQRGKSTSTGRKCLHGGEGNLIVIPVP